MFLQISKQRRPSSHMSIVALLRSDGITQCTASEARATSPVRRALDTATTTASSSTATSTSATTTSATATLSLESVGRALCSLLQYSLV
jgi:hypothetical protein